MVWSNSPRQKEIKATLLKLHHSTRQESSLTFPPGFSIRGLVRHAAARLQYTGFHRCSCRIEDTHFRLWRLSHSEEPFPSLKTASSTKCNGCHWNTWASIFTGLLQAAACANLFNLAQGHITKPLSTCPKNSQIHVDRNSEYFCFIS